MNHAKLFMLVGLPASGKSSLANEICKHEENNTVIHSSDVLRKELFVDENVNDNNHELFTELHRRIKNDLRSGINVIYDATNINKSNRHSFLQELKNIQCEKICICVMVPYNACLHFNSLRDRKVPKYVIERMYKHWCPPHYSEGFDKIFIHIPKIAKQYTSDYTFAKLFDKETGIDTIEQENKHHSLTIGAHCRKAYEYIKQQETKREDLEVAALLHDNGKVFTKTRINAKGVFDGDCHYYQHHCVGAYDSIFYLNDYFETATILYIANLIYYHMFPFLSWAKSEKSRNKAIQFIGTDMYNDIMLLHQADMEAH